MRKGHYKTVTVPATTNNITKGIINFLNSEGHVAVRINVGGIYDPVYGKHRPSGGTVGVLDIQCTLAPIGRTLVIDTKKGKDSASPEQEQYAADVTAAGGIAYFAPSVDAFIEFYTNFIKPQLQR